VPVNNGVNSLHGGIEGFDKKFWAAEVAKGEVILRYTSKHGEEGYPGQLDTTVT
jgi:aldose 1-epimerase